MHTLAYHVFNGYRWLADDEHSWTTDYFAAAAFSDPKLAQDIGEREGGSSIYVMGCLGWQS